MKTTRTSRLALFAPALLYILLGIEIVIMISPFALYFYSVYGPVLGFLGASPLLAWTTEFFLPHMIFPDDGLILAISYLQLLLPIGLLLFLSAAIPLYWGRFTRKGVVTAGFYRKIRHPQYLFLAISGFGLLLYWPRFIVLFLYVSMLHVYYLLARNEEARMQREAPGVYDQYLAETPMFLPGEPGGRLFRALFGWIRPKGLALFVSYLVVLGVSVLAALGVRNHSVRALPLVRTESTVLAPVFPRPADEVKEAYQAALASPLVQAATKDAPAANVVYIMPGDFFLTALVTDENRRFSPEFLAHFPEAVEWHQHKFRGGLKKFFLIFYNFVSTLGDVETDYDIERLVFVRVTEADGSPAPADQVFAIGLARRPVLIVDLDAHDHRILAVGKPEPRHKWGSMPMPTF